MTARERAAAVGVECGNLTCAATVGNIETAIRAAEVEMARRAAAALEAKATAMEAALPAWDCYRGNSRREREEVAVRCLREMAAVVRALE